MSKTLPKTASEAPFCLSVRLPNDVTECEGCRTDAEKAEPGDEVAALLGPLATELAAAASFGNRSLGCLYFSSDAATSAQIPTALVRCLLAEVRERFDCHALREVAFRSTPLAVTACQMRRLCEAGVTRISVAAGALDDGVLRRNGFAHTRCDVERAYAAIRRHDFPAVDVELLCGLEGETDASFAASVEQLIELEPDSVTLQLRREIEEARLARAFDRLAAAGYVVLATGEAVCDPERHRCLYAAALEEGADVLAIGRT